MHLRVLREAGLVSARAEGARRLYELEPDPLAGLRDHLDWYWTQALESSSSMSKRKETSRWSRS